MSVTNRDLQRAFKFSPTQIRRWAILALGADPKFPQSGGISRQYDDDDAFLIFVLGMLIIGLNLGQKEAQQHIHNIGPELKKHGLIPSQYKETVDKYHQTLGHFEPLVIKLFMYPTFDYVIKITYNYSEFNQTIEGNQQKCHEDFIKIQFTGDKKEAIKAKLSVPIEVPLSVFLDMFIDFILT